MKYVLYRSVDGAAREAIYRTGEDGRRSFRDRDVKPGQSIRYAVVAVSCERSDRARTAVPTGS